jgi:hypothetical protein
MMAHLSHTLDGNSDFESLTATVFVYDGSSFSYALDGDSLSGMERVSIWMFIES